MTLTSTMRLSYLWTLAIIFGQFANSAACDTTSPSVAIIRDRWTDSQRKRDIPVKIYRSDSASTVPSPVIIVSHGLGGTREGMEYLGRAWAAAGYVSVHIQHPGSDDDVWRKSRQPMAAMRAAAADPQNAIQRPRDVRFVLDHISRLNAQPGEWQGRLDLSRIGMAGHSFGAYTTQAIAGQRFAGIAGDSPLADARAKAALILSPFVPREKDPEKLKRSFGAITIPCMHMTGTRDDSPIGDTNAAERRIPFDCMSKSDQYLVTFADGNHGVFSGERGRRAGGEHDAAYQELIAKVSLKYWDAYLKNDGSAKVWLKAKDGCRSLLERAATVEIKSTASASNSTEALSARTGTHDSQNALVHTSLNGVPAGSQATVR